MTDHSHRKFSNPRVIVLIATGIVVLVMLMIGLNSSQKEPASRSSAVSNAEAAATLASFRLEVAKEALDESGIVTERDCESLKQVVREFDAESDWFSECRGTFYIDNKDTDQKQITTIADGERCAVITADEDLNIIEYEFKDEHCKGYESYFGEPQA